MVENDSEENYSVMCSNCGFEMQSFGAFEFRVGGETGVGSFLFGKWAELGESVLPFDVYVCSKCGKVELRADEVTRRILLEEKNRKMPKSFLKACVRCGKNIPIASEECRFCGSKQPSR